MAPDKGSCFSEVVYNLFCRLNNLFNSDFVKHVLFHSFMFLNVLIWSLMIINIYSKLTVYCNFILFLAAVLQWIVKWYVTDGSFSKTAITFGGWSVLFAQKTRKNLIARSWFQWHSSPDKSFNILLACVWFAISFFLLFDS